jgi:formamidopyrimidine-DNA glycosylase
MPELPEVETTLRGIEPYIIGNTVQAVVIRHYGLRWPIPHDLPEKLQGQVIQQVKRRAKYLLLETQTGSAILHLGMSGRLQVLNQARSAQKHDHVDIQFANQIILRFTDPRRFGALLWTENTATHPLLQQLGVEPFDPTFSGKYLWLRAQNKKISIKSFIMDNKIVVGVGNIYAAESLFLAGITPMVPAQSISLDQFQQLAKSIKLILRQAIKQGGTTLKDFMNSEGKPGYFSQSLKVYGRAGLPCFQCGTLLTLVRIGQRSTVFCQRCQS